MFGACTGVPVAAFRFLMRVEPRIALPFTDSISTTIVLMTLGLAFIAATIGNAWALAGISRHRRWSVRSARSRTSGGYFGGAFSPVAAGFIVDRTGSYSLAFVIGGAIAGCAALFYWFMARTRVEDDAAVSAP
ncbi:hypothetical protein YK56LOC_36050 [Caballeronia sp. HLA56]